MIISVITTRVLNQSDFLGDLFDSCLFSCMDFPGFAAIMPRWLYLCSVCSCVSMGLLLEKVKHRQPAGWILPGHCGVFWTNISRSSAGWGLEDAIFPPLKHTHTHMAHIKNDC